MSVVHFFKEPLVLTSMCLCDHPPQLLLALFAAAYTPYSAWLCKLFAPLSFMCSASSYRAHKSSVHIFPAAMLESKAEPSSVRSSRKMNLRHVAVGSRYGAHLSNWAWNNFSKCTLWFMAAWTESSKGFKALKEHTGQHFRSNRRKKYSLETKTTT